MDAVVRKWAACLAAVLLFVTVGPSARAAAVSARAYALVEQTTGRVIAGADMGERLPMASTTKIMTGLLACESGELDKTFTVPPEALTVEGSSMGLQPDESITLRALVYGLLLESGNDAANSIAMLLGGSVEGFAAQMNAKARALHLNDTHFANPSGLGADGHYTTALDLARLGAYAMKNPDFAQIVGTRRATVSYNGIANARTLINHNRLLGSYDGEIGIKTGFTKKSGRCLVSCARRGGVTLVLATLNDPDDWRDHAALLDQGFSELQARPLLAAPVERRVRVTDGARDTVAVRCDPAVSAALRAEETGQVAMQVRLPGKVEAPVRAGQKIGELRFTLDGAEIAHGDLLAVAAVAKAPPRPNPFVSFFRGVGAFFARLFGQKNQKSVASRA
ncbi:D-alanyl-D-alanine carboxypeptidase family protein [Ethanoligenens harbinense]|uniref:D-alanyl-D-alanine carboxypeptidase family protein n=1 Tax=Ethanoligenens harbinense TaxID=253239 RepID=UPI0002EE0B72|nr:D-alanyl-D-alanine carboxypeptidase family protein [Ethanoligenens harbinense]AVQ96675.1 D-alanyl-D-alanine carboxypeptidase [Ethanoligenens harbinense YUAN-3]AYF39335.1 D-alanyl-D-alanine carboxypeptidase [Ethanoligenens harbinense]AYF42160.1 D-alanyl-D-alanine carboxypeptidase [Ethanoligenens harbinense]QCN92915.1 D-alanyl-D-alanine carboxypeptidase [Ethanoligenens harbinense]